MTFDKPHDFVIVQVFTVGFRKIEEKRLNFTMPGSLSILLDPARFKGGLPANGLYYVRVKTPSEQWILKLIILR